MRTIRAGVLTGFAVVILLGAVARPTPARADDSDETLRKRALALNDVTGDDPIQGEIKALEDDAAGTRKLLAVAVKMARDKKQQPFNFNGAYILARTAQHLRDLESGRVFYGVCTEAAAKLQSAQKLGQAYEGLSLMLLQEKKYDETAKVCKAFLELPADGPTRRAQFPMLRRLITALARQGKIDEATKLVDKLVEIQPENWLLLELRAVVQQEAGRYEDAIKTYDEVVTYIGKDKSLKAEDKDELADVYRYYQTGVYVDANHVDKAIEVLRALLARHPNDPSYNNDLGYVMADHDQNLEESEKLIRKALEEDRKQRKAIPDFRPEDDKDSPAYLDSLGWVLYKQKKYKEAKQYLVEAVKDKEGQHIEIMDHLADVHLALGEKTDAVAVWKKALELENTTRREIQRKAIVEKKLKEHQ
jgi:tetratricopeptide (TPR) repeat protein